MYSMSDLILGFELRISRIPALLDPETISGILDDEIVISFEPIPENPGLTLINLKGPVSDVQKHIGKLNLKSQRQMST